MHLPPTQPDDPIAAVARTAALASLQRLHDELVLARRATRLALDALPRTSLEWLGAASEAFEQRSALLRADVVAARDPLVTAVAVVAAELP